MKISIKAKTLVKIVALLSALTVSFEAGYFKSQWDDSRYSHSYTVSTEELPNESELVMLETEHEEEPELMININTASSEELEQLKGIGSALAGRIIEYREANGIFEHRYDIMDVKGIGAGIYKNIKENICVN